MQSREERHGLKFLTTVLLLVLVVAALTAWAIYVPIGPAAGTTDEAATYVDIAPGTGPKPSPHNWKRSGCCAVGISSTYCA